MPISRCLCHLRVAILRYKVLFPLLTAINQQAGVYPYPLGTGSARQNQKKGAPDTENPWCIDFTVLGGGLENWPDHGVGVDPSVLN